MAILSFQYARQLKQAGAKLQRAGLSERVIALVDQFEREGGTYKGAMNLAGRLKAIAQAAKFDGYWTEKVDDGFHKERFALSEAAKKQGVKTVDGESTADPK